VIDRDIWATANTLMRLHQEDALMHACMRADALLDAGDIEGQRVWLRVVAAIRTLSDGKVPEVVHQASRYRPIGVVETSAGSSRGDPKANSKSLKDRSDWLSTSACLLPVLGVNTMSNLR
jgi:hypothetical protein